MNPSLAARLRALSDTRWLAPTLAWAAAAGVMILAFRPFWKVPLQGDDFLVLMILSDQDDAGVADVAYRNMAHNVSTSSTHFNPIGYYLEGALKAAMIGTKSSVFTGSVIHHGTVAILMLGALVFSAILLSRILAVFGNAVVPASRLAVPLAVGFAATAQTTAMWAMYDPLVVQPIFGALPTFLGLAYFACSLEVLARPGPRWKVIVASLLGVIGLLVYEIGIVFVVALIFTALLGRNRGLSGMRTRLPWLIVPALLTLVVSRLVVTSHPAIEYGGTAFNLDLSVFPTLVVATMTSVPGALWGTSAQHVSVATVVPFALVSAGLVASVFWVWWRFGQGRTPEVDSTTDTDMAPRRFSPLAVVPVFALLVLAPAPYVVSEMWGPALLVFGTTYMHSLISVWCWAMLIAVGAWRLAQRRPSPWIIAAVVLVLALWVGQQFSVNRQLEAQLVSNPKLGLDVTATLDNPTVASEDQRCASLAIINANPNGAFWVPIFNREFAERHDGQTYCGPIAD